MKRNFRVIDVSLCALLLLLGVQEANAVYNIPSERVVQWKGNAGVSGDIPTRTTICATLSPSGADDTKAIASAIATCPNDQVVKLNGGVFNVSAPILVKSSTTLRGSGMGNTVIRGTPGMSGRFVMGMGTSASLGTSLALTRGLNKGSTTITTSTAHGWSAGNIILIDQLNNPNDDPPVSNIGNNGTCTWCGRANGARALGQVVKVVAVPSTTTAILEMPLYWNYDPALSPQGTRLQGLTQSAGIEDLTIDNGLSGSSAQVGYGAVVLSGVANSWVLNVEIIGSYQTGLQLNRGAYRNTIRGCKLHEGIPVTAQDGSEAFAQNRAYGINSALYSSANLIENNQLYHLAAGLMTAGPFSGNVIAYNYITELYLSALNFNPYSVSFHGGHAFMNLIEGNYIESRLASDAVWGTKSSITLFRNKIMIAPDRTGGAWDIDIQANSRYFNVIGNILGRGTEGIYALESMNSKSPSIYRLGYNSDGDGDLSGNDPGVAKTLLRHANWDSLHQYTLLNDNFDPALNSSDAVLPPSLYLSTKPGWWGNTAWPAIGPDLVPMFPAAPGAGKGTPWNNATGSIATPSVPGALVSANSWQNKEFLAQHGLFTAVFDLIPNAANINAVTLLSATAAKTYSDGALIVRFNSEGVIDAMNGSAYNADTKIAYTAGTRYHVRVQGDVGEHKYDVFVTPAGGTEIKLASGYSFRNEQLDATSIGNLGIFAQIGSHQVFNLQVTTIPTYSLIATAGTGGTISPSGTIVLASGQTQAYSIAPSDGYRITDVKVDGASKGAVTSYTFNEVSANHLISAAFTPTTVSTNIWRNQSFSPQAGRFTAEMDLIPLATNINAVTVLSAIPARAYTDGAIVIRFNTNGTIDARNGGSYAASAPLPYSAGVTYHVRAVVDVLLHRYDVFVKPGLGAEVQIAKGFAFRTEQSSVTSLNNIGIFADSGSHYLENFSASPVPRYAIAATAGTGGRISPSGSVSVYRGTNQVFTITPSSGYRISSVIVDGRSVGAVSSYTFTQVSGNHKIQATFRRR